MAKKSTKSTRRSRAKKEQAPKKKVTATKQQIAPEELMVIAEGSNEPVVKAEKKTPAKKPTAEKPKKTDEPLAADQVAIEEAVQEIVEPPRSRMLVSAFALGVIIIALIFGAAIMRQQNAQGVDSAKPGQRSAAADEILQTGGKMCTNEQATSDVNGSTNPQSAGMVLQTNPSNNIQTPQTFSSGSSDAAALQGAACF